MCATTGRCAAGSWVSGRSRESSPRLSSQTRSSTKSIAPGRITYRDWIWSCRPGSEVEVLPGSVVEPIRPLDQEYVPCRGRKDAAEVAREIECPLIGIRLTALLPYREECRAWFVLPPEHVRRS